jgi:hypothetical protein
VKRKPGGVKPRRPVGLDVNANHIQKIQDRHAGGDIIVVGSGSSLEGFKFSSLNNFPTIALNDALKAPGFFPRYHLWTDQNLYDGSVASNPSGGYRKWQYSPLTEIVTQRTARSLYLEHRGASWNPVWQFNQAGQPAGIKRTDDNLYIERTVATGAIMLAWKLGAARVLLLGIDGYRMHRDGGEVYYYDGTTKPPGDRKRKIVRTENLPDAQGGHGARLQVQLQVQDRHDFWRKNMEKLCKHLRGCGDPYPGPFPGPGVYNLSPMSTISVWQKVDRELALSWIEAFPGRPG